MNWGYDIEQRIRDFLLEEDPRFKDEIDGGYHWLQVPSRLSRFYMRDVLAYLDEFYPKTVSLLDYGTGTGVFLAYLYSHGYTNIEGRDSNLHRVEVGNKLMKHLGFPVTIMGVGENDIYHIRGKWTIITMLDMLSYLPFDIPAIIKNTKQCIEPNGCFIFDILEQYAKPQPNLWSRQRIKELLTKEGYEVKIISSLEQTGDAYKNLYVARLRS